MQADELREQSDEQLKKLLLDLHREQFNLRMQKGTGQAVRPSELKALRRDIARIKTILNKQSTSRS